MRLSLRRRPHVLLVLLLVTMLAIYPLVERVAAGRAAVNLAIVASIVVVLYRVGAWPRAEACCCSRFSVRSPWRDRSCIGTALPGPPGFASALAQTLFYAGAAYLMCVYMLGDTRATLDELFAAAAAFILLALGWASAFWCIEYLGPGSFVSANPAHPERRTWFELLYLSMTTLSTTGFGDIVPVSSTARAAVILEQFAERALRCAPDRASGRVRRTGGRPAGTGSARAIRGPDRG